MLFFYQHVGSQRSHFACDNTFFNFKNATMHGVNIFAIRQGGGHIHSHSVSAEIHEHCALLPTAHLSYFCVSRLVSGFSQAAHRFAEFVHGSHFRVNELVVATRTYDIVAPHILGRTVVGTRIE